MKNVKLSDETREIGKPENWSAPEHGECVSISVCDQNVDGLQMMTTFWQPTREELRALVAGGYIALSINGTQHPVIQLAVTAP